MMAGIDTSQKRIEAFFVLLGLLRVAVSENAHYVSYDSLTIKELACFIVNGILFFIMRESIPKRGQKRSLLPILGSFIVNYEQFYPTMKISPRRKIAHVPRNVRKSGSKELDFL